MLPTSVGVEPTTSWSPVGQNMMHRTTCEKGPLYHMQTAKNQISLLIHQSD